MEWSMLSKDEKERLRGLAKEHAENIGLHILAAYTLEESDPQSALEHAKWAARQASRIDFSRETLAFVSYRQGDYKLALREFQTAHRMNGFADYLPFMADCERGLGNPKKAIELALSDEGKSLQGESKVEMFLVYAGALGDLQLWDQAIEIVHKLGASKGLPGAYRMRALQAEQNFLEESGHSDQATDLDPVIEWLELQYADEDEDEESDDIVIDYDLEDLPGELMDQLGISWDDAQYAPDDGADGSDGASAAGDAEHSEDAEEAIGNSSEGAAQEIAHEEEEADASEDADVIEAARTVEESSMADVVEDADAAAHVDAAVDVDTVPVGTAADATEENVRAKAAAGTVDGEAGNAEGDDEQELPAQEAGAGVDAAVDPAALQSGLAPETADGGSEE
jgi:tetratricopeptide (TPR) repeat protein